MESFQNNLVNSDTNRNFTVIL